LKDFDVFFFLAAQNDFRPAQTSTAVTDVKVGLRALLRNRQATHETDELRQKQLFDTFCMDWSKSIENDLI
jgi:hypothetical protein